MTEKTIPFLKNYKEFAEFLEFIVDERESCMADMHSKDVNGIMQISGKILAYDEIIKATDAHRVIRLHERTAG